MNPPGGAGGGAARDVSGEASRAAGTCWLCGQAVENPPDIIGHRDANGRIRIAHRHCQRTLGELDLNLPFPPSAA